MISQVHSAALCGLLFGLFNDDVLHHLSRLRSRTAHRAGRAEDIRTHLI